MARDKVSAKIEADARARAKEIGARKPIEKRPGSWLRRRTDAYAERY
jgi:hypothetical protein